MSNVVPIIGGAGGAVATGPVLAVSGAPPQATAGTFYSWTPSITGAQGNIRVTLDGGLPNGLSLVSATGEVRGTPATSQTTNFGLTIRDDVNVAFLPGLMLTVAPSVVIARSNLVAGLGDSRVPTFLDGATARQKGGADTINNACALALQKNRLVGAFGASGKRVDEYLSAGLSTVIGYTPGAVVLPSVLNSIGQDFPTQSTSGSDAASRIITAIETMRSSGIVIVVMSEIGQVGLATVRRDQIDIYNNTMQAYAASRGGVTFLDIRPAVCGADRLPLAAYVYDGTHLNQLGALVVGRILKSILDMIMPAADSWVLGANGLPSIPNQVQLLANPLFATTTGGSTSTGATGTFAGSCNFNKTGASTALTVTSAAGNVKLDCTFGAQNDNCRMSQAVPLANWSSGMKVRATALIRVEGTPVGLAGVQLTLVATGDSVSTTYADMFATATWAGPNDSYRMLLMTQEYVIPTYTTKSSLSATITAPAFGGGAAVVYIEQMGVLQNTA